MTSTHESVKYLDVGLSLQVPEQISIRFGEKMQRAVAVLCAGSQEADAYKRRAYSSAGLEESSGGERHILIIEQEAHDIIDRVDTAKTLVVTTAIQIHRMYKI